MRDFIYDLRRTLTGKFTIVMIVLIVLATVGIAYAAVSFSSGSSVAPGSEAYVYPAVFKTSYGYNVTDFVANGYGQPVAGLSIDSSLVNSTKMDNLTGTTNGYGYFNTTVPLSAGNYSQYRYNPLYISGINVSGELPISVIKNNLTYAGYLVSNSAVWQSTSNQSAYFIAKVANPSSKTISNIEIYYASANGSAMPDASLYYYVQNSSSIATPSLSSKEMTLYGQIGGFHNKVFTLPLNATANGFNVMVELFPPSGGTQPIVMLSSAILYSSTSSGALLEAILQVPYEFLIPILGIFSVYL